ncbi:MAG: substrate-binding domain-containing protein [Clostridiales bacterium]|nr:substrate-binding domain-containing protein [Clostridiales bacterium]
MSKSRMITRRDFLKGSAASTASLMAFGLLGGVDKSVHAAEVDTSETVNLTMYLYGGEGVANQEVLDVLNEILLADINATLEIKYIDWGDVSTKYPLLWSAGEDFDMAYVSSGASIPYATLAAQDALTDITDLLDTCAPTLKEALTENAWNSMYVNDRIYGVPSTYSEFTAYGFVTRTDLMEEFGTETISSLEDMETYMDAAVEAGWVPLNGSSGLGSDMYRMFVALTDDWIDAPGLSTDLYLAATVSEPSNIFHPAFTDEFEEFAVRMHEWAEKGYWSVDILSASQDDKDNFYNGLSAAYVSHQPDWTGNYGTQKTKLPGVETEFYCFPEENGKIVAKMGVENATGINVNSKHPERCLMLIEKLMTDETCYRLFQYGIEGRQYEIVDGMITTPDSYDSEVDGFGFSGWALRTDALNVPSESEDPRRYTLNEEWNEVAIDNPYVGFAFDSSELSAELSAIANVDSQLGLQILLGKTTQGPLEAVETYRSQLQTAGIDDLIAGVTEQYKAFLGE